MNTNNTKVQDWVDECAKLTQPDHVVWLKGTAEEYQSLLAEAVKSGQLLKLNEKNYPNSYLHRSHPSDVARTEQCTFVCTKTKEDAGPNNNWTAPAEALSKLKSLFDGSMRGRTMYVIPYLLGPQGSPYSRVGFELTDSVYVAINMSIMTRMGRVALERLGSSSDDFIRGLHSTGTLDPSKRTICHFPETKSIYSIHSGYGGNALLSKKCAALRIASWLGKKEGWLAEHMLIMGVEDPQGKITYLAAALPSACGKTNLAMLEPPARFKGYKIWCVGDDIAWLHPGADGRLYAINPEAGFFGVAPGTSERTNPNMMKAISRNTIFTNVALTSEGDPWWEGLDLPSGQSIVDWQGNPWDPKSGAKAAHPNARFTTSIDQCPITSAEWDNPRGVPISAILFGCRRSSLVPLVYESLDWKHGVYLGATLNSETTAAAVGATGVVRRDPMAMLPFAGYNMADYFSHWLDLGRKLIRPPKIYRVNWFRKDASGNMIWPGYGENLRVLKWIIGRSEGTAGAVKTPIGYLPALDSFDTEGLSVTPDEIEQLFAVDCEGWIEAATKQTEFFSKFGERYPESFKRRFPKELLDQQDALILRLKK